MEFFPFCTFPYTNWISKICVLLQLFEVQDKDTNELNDNVRVI